MESPIEMAKRLTPWWMIEIKRFDGLELHPVRSLSCPGVHQSWQEQCEPHNAEAWSIFGHCINGGAESFGDFPTEEEARAFAERLLKAYPHLRTFGLLG